MAWLPWAPWAAPWLDRSGRAYPPGHPHPCDLYLCLHCPGSPHAALATEDPTPDLLDKKPHGRNEPLISGRMWKQLVSQGLYQLFWLFLIFYGGPKYISIYEKPNQCAYWNSTTNLCCVPGSSDCLAADGGYYNTTGGAGGCVAPVGAVLPAGFAAEHPGWLAVQRVRQQGPRFIEQWQ